MNFKDSHNINLQENEEMTDELDDALKFLVQNKSEDVPSDDQMRKWYTKYGCDSNKELYAQIWSDMIKIKDFTGSEKEFLLKYFVGNPNAKYPLKYKNQEKKIDDKQLIIDQTINTKEDKDFFIKVLWRGNYSLKQSFWAFYLLPGLVFAFLIFILLPTVLLPNAYTGVSIIYYLIVFTAIFYFILSMVGTWKSAIKYTNKKKLLNKPYDWAISAQIFVVLEVVLRIVNIANILNE